MCSAVLTRPLDMSDNVEQLKKDLTHFMYQLRINAEVYVKTLVRCGVSVGCNLLHRLDHNLVYRL